MIKPILQLESSYCVRNTSVRLETLLQKYIAEVHDGQRASSISSVTTISSLSSTDKEAWRQI